MNELESLNRRPGIATNAMCMLLAINTSSITLIPVSIIGILALSHGKDPTVIIGTSLAATVIAHAAAITACKLLEKSPFYRLPPAPKNAIPARGEKLAVDHPAGPRRGEETGGRGQDAAPGFPARAGSWRCWPERRSACGSASPIRS